MSNQVLGPERAMMTGPNGGGFFVRGSGNIESKLAQGWVIIVTDRNHLTRDVDQYELVDNKPVRVYEAGSQAKNGSTATSNEPFEHEPIEVPQQVAVQERKRGRPRKHHRP